MVKVGLNREEFLGSSPPTPFPLSNQTLGVLIAMYQKEGGKKS